MEDNREDDLSKLSTPKDLQDSIAKICDEYEKHLNQAEVQYLKRMALKHCQSIIDMPERIKNPNTSQQELINNISKYKDVVKVLETILPDQLPADLIKICDHIIPLGFETTYSVKPKELQDIVDKKLEIIKIRHSLVNCSATNIDPLIHAVDHAARVFEKRRDGAGMKFLTKLSVILKKIGITFRPSDITLGVTGVGVAKNLSSTFKNYAKKQGIRLGHPEEDISLKNQPPKIKKP